MAIKPLDTFSGAQRTSYTAPATATSKAAPIEEAKPWQPPPSTKQASADDDAAGAGRKGIYDPSLYKDTPIMAQIKKEREEESRKT